VFAFLWATAILCHLWNQIEWPKVPWPPSPLDGAVNLAAAAAAVAVLLRPSSVRRLLVLAGVQVLHAGIGLPGVGNHWFLAMLVNACILVSAARVLPRAVPGDGASARLLADFAPPVRLVLIICYGFAALAKFNHDFLDLDVGCSAAYYASVNTQWLGGLLPGAAWARAAAVYGTLVSEVLLAAALLVPRIRAPGLVAGVVFHFIISATPVVRVPDFMLILYALLYLFLPPAFTERLRGWGRRSRILAEYPPRVLGGLVAVSLAVVVGTFALTGDIGPRSWAPLHTLRLLLFDLAAMGWIAAFLAFLGPWTRPLALGGEPLARLRSPFHGLVVLVAAVSVLSPYVGLKTRTAFTMFSNLRTEARPDAEGVPVPGNNHLFLPQIYLAGYQKDLVTIVSSSDERLQRAADAGQLLTWFELVNITSRHPEARLNYRRHGKSRLVYRVGEDAALSTPHPWILRKLLIFRPVAKEGPSPCDW
jgi:hypothetical protein